MPLIIIIIVMGHYQCEISLSLRYMDRRHFLQFEELLDLDLFHHGLTTPTYNGSYL